MATQLIAHYSNRFDTWEGRKNATDSEVLLTTEDTELARHILTTVHFEIARQVDTMDLVAVAVVVDGVEVERTGTRKTTGYALEERAHADSFKR